MRGVHKFLLIVGLVGTLTSAFSQNNTVTSGTWNDPTIWSAGTVPVNTSTVNVNHPETIDANISISSGNYTFNASSTDFTGGTAHTLTMTGGTLTIGNGSNTPIVTFEGAGTFANATIVVSTGAMLVLGQTTFNNGNTVTIQAGGTLYVNGTLFNSNSSGTITIAGVIYVDGDYDTNNGNLSVSGSGDLITTGTIFNQGSSEVFGSNNDCGTGPCSGQNLCTGQLNNVTPTSQFICSGGSISALDGTPMTNVTYQWQLSTTGAAATDFANIVGATSEDYTPSVPSVTTFYRRVATSTTVAGCVGRSVAAQISISPTGSWSGNTSTDWNVASNWCGNAIPTATTDVVINSNATRQPTISNANATCRNLTILAGAVVTITDRTLAVRGNLSYNGAIVFDGSVTGRVSLISSNPQTISGSTPYIFNNLTINNSAASVPAVTFAGNAITVNKNLSLTEGTVDLSGYNVTIGLSAAAPGSLSFTSGRFYNGNVTRWFGTGAVTVEAVGGFFPLGTSTSERPFYLGFTGLTTGGTVRVQHTGVSGSTAASFNDVNTTVAIQAVSNSFWTVSSANGLAYSGSPFSATAGGTGLGTVSDAVNHLRLTRQAAAIGGNAGTNAASTTDLRVRRTAFAFPTNPFNVYIASTNSTLSPLPITLTHFSARPTVEGVSLQWTTSMEEDFSHFSIERSRDGITFQEISETQAKGGRNLATHYSYVDGGAKSGRFYYRLKSVDLDGSHVYSSVERVDMENASLSIASIYPNPIAGKFNVSVFDGRAGKLVLIDKYGRNVAEHDVQEGTQELEFQNLPSGIYYARIQTEAGAQTIKIVLK